uniref:ATP-dependent DNA ligase family profile domain-containing protein n=1 Tax=Kwoniella dejecticola CBS 10117 TaxID=1296121 RepID=A0A1A5ZX07_9TREE|nr:uncharacterized protein I303_07098 [Kwoniella dejecticola CBS 10117]OBR82339.1 hypothetical protein I303_07098 [Kwoniella dejecticola CBS 10117]
MDIPFESFAKLVYHLGNPPRSPQTATKVSKALAPQKIFQSWLNHLAKPFSPGTGKHLFRLLFPHEGSRRRYGLKESKLALELERILGVRGLGKWDCVSWEGNDSGTGCLGKEVELAMRDRSSQSSSSHKSKLTIREVDLLLDELATSSSFSQLSQLPTTFRSPQTILSILYRESGLSPYGLCVLTQIILRDLRPLLNPLPKLPIRNPTTMLRMKSNTGPDQLTLRDAMITWDKRIWEFYNGGRGNIDVCADIIESLDNGLQEGIVMTGPLLGTNVKVSSRMRTDAWRRFRLQIHVTCPEGEPSIKIFSKSTRDSTQDRLNTHSIILASLNLPLPGHLPIHPALEPRIADSPQTPKGKGVSSIILEAEVVPYNESSREGGREPGIEEFWWLGLAGVTTEAHNQIHDNAFPKRSSRHLCLVFFDILYLNGQSLLHRRYEERRTLLEQTIRPIRGFSRLAERTRISLGLNRQTAIQSLEEAFRRSNEHHEEGLVLKASNSTYTNMRWQWVKLKKDYIPNLGDCIDLVLLGAGWDIDRARELRVDTSVFTTFYLGVLTNAARVTSRKELPHFEILFRVSYGPDRTQLEYYNECLRYGRWGNKPFDKDDPFKRYYELRWPRLQKIYEPSERQWVDALSAQDLIKTAHQSLGYNIPATSPYSPPSGEDSIRAMWRSHSTINLIDKPQSFSPISPTSPISPKAKSPTSPKRVMSEPNLALLRDTHRRPHDDAPTSPLALKGVPFRLPEKEKTDPGEGEAGQNLAALISDNTYASPRTRIASNPQAHEANERLEVQNLDEPFHEAPPIPRTTASPPRSRPQPLPQVQNPEQNRIILGPPLPLASVSAPAPASASAQAPHTPRKSPQRKISQPANISPAKRLISSIDWSTLDVRNHSTPKFKPEFERKPRKRAKRIDVKRDKINSRKEEIGNKVVKPLSLRSRIKLASRRIGVRS